MIRLRRCSVIVIPINCVEYTIHTNCSGSSVSCFKLFSLISSALFTVNLNFLNFISIFSANHIIDFFLEILYFKNVNLLFSQLKTFLNPGCPSTICKSGPEHDAKTLIHIKADGENDSLHYVWDFVNGQPTVLVALTELNTNVAINWDQLTNKTPNVLTFSTVPKYTMSFILTKVSALTTIHNIYS